MSHRIVAPRTLARDKASAGPPSGQELARELMLSLAAPPWSADIGSALAPLTEGCDWQYFLNAARRHHLAPLLHWRLDQAGLRAAVPEGVRQGLADNYAANLARNIYLLSETEALCERFHQVGIPIMLFKGIALLEDVYSPPGLRPMEDVDILVHPKDAPAVRRILLSECGYRVAATESAAIDAVTCEAHFEKTNSPPLLGRILLEVHWEIAPIEYAWRGRRPPACDLWKRARPVRVGSETAFAPSQADHLCQIALHNCIHAFSRLIGLMDFACLVDRLAGDSEWREMLGCATGQGLRMALYVNFLLAQRLLKIEIPGHVVNGLRPWDGRSRILAGLLNLDTLFDEDFSFTRRYLVRALSVDGILDVVRVLTWTLFPSPAWLEYRRELHKIKPMGRGVWARGLDLLGYILDAAKRLTGGHPEARSR